MRKILYGLAFVFLGLAVQAMPVQDERGGNSLAVAWAGEDDWGPDNEGCPASPIVDAACKGDWEKVFALAKTHGLGGTDCDGLSVLHVAAMSASDDVIIKLLKLGANKNAHPAGGMTVYDFAKMNKKLSPEVREMLR